MGNRIAKHVFDDDWMLEKSTYYVLDAQGNQISMYEHEVDQQAVNYTLAERNIYGSARLGRNSHKIDLYTADLENPVSSVLGEKYYELSNHLENVLAVINDVKYPVATGTTVDYFEVALVSVSDYSPFGMQMPGRSFNSDEYRYGFNGMEKDDEIKGEGNHYDLGLRNYDPRIGRMFSIDPRANEYPWQTTYAYHRNSPIMTIDYLGGGDDDGIYKDIETGEVLFDDGVDDGEVHYVCREDLCSNEGSSLARNFSPEQRKEMLSSIVQSEPTPPSKPSSSLLSMYDVEPIPDHLRIKGGVGPEAILLGGGLPKLGQLGVALFSGIADWTSQAIFKGVSEVNYAQTFGATLFGQFKGGDFVGATVGSTLDWRPFSSNPVNQSLGFSWDRGQSANQVLFNFGTTYGFGQINRLQPVNSLNLETGTTVFFTTFMGQGVSGLTEQGGPIR